MYCLDLHFHHFIRICVFMNYGQNKNVVRLKIANNYSIYDKK